MVAIFKRASHRAVKFFFHSSPVAPLLFYLHKTVHKQALQFKYAPDKLKPCDARPAKHHMVFARKYSNMQPRR